MHGSSLLCNPSNYNPGLLPTSFDVKFKELLPTWSLLLILFPNVSRGFNLPSSSFGFTIASELSTIIFIFILIQHQLAHSLAPFPSVMFSLDHRWVNSKSSIEWTKPLIIIFPYIEVWGRPCPMGTLQVVVVAKTCTQWTVPNWKFSCKNNPKHIYSLYTIFFWESPLCEWPERIYKQKFWTSQVVSFKKRPTYSPSPQ